MMQTSFKRPSIFFQGHQEAEEQSGGGRRQRNGQRRLGGDAAGHGPLLHRRTLPRLPNAKDLPQPLGVHLLQVRKRIVKNLNIWH